jgi:hypothetical protein
MRTQQDLSKNILRKNGYTVCIHNREICVCKRKKEKNMSQETKNIVRSWLNVFIAAVITAWLTLLVSTQTLALSWQAGEAILIAGLVAALPVVRNYFDTHDHRYGRGYEEEE